MNQQLINEKIIQSKKWCAALSSSKDTENLIIRLNKLNKELVLAIADFRCENPACKSEENLTIHHLIPRKAKEYTHFWRYASQRYYWANSICLCLVCHQQYHKFVEKEQDNDMGCISEIKIKKWKELYK